MAGDTVYCTFEELISGVSQELGSICIALRKAIIELHPEFVEVCWQKQKIVSYGLGPKKMSEHYTYLGLYKAHVNLGFYYGASLSDPEGLLEGTGKNLRHIKIKTVEEAANPQIISLIGQAVAERKKALA